MSFDKSIQGVQSLTKKVSWKGVPAIQKISKYVDFTPELEFSAWQKLKLLNATSSVGSCGTSPAAPSGPVPHGAAPSGPVVTCPHFCEIYEKAPLSKKEVEFCLFFKEISLNWSNEKRNVTLGDIIFESQHSPQAFINCVNQTVAAILMLEKVGITHYDLHSDNVMITNANYDAHMYITPGEGGAFKVSVFETHGITPVIIDFGVSHVPDSHLNATCMFTGSGFTPFMNDPLVDVRLLFTTVKKDFTEYLRKKAERRPTGKPQKNLKELISLKKYNKYITSVFSPLKPLINQKTGWFKDKTFPSIINDLKSEIKSLKLNQSRGMFKSKNIDWFFEILQHRIRVPLRNGEDLLGLQDEPEPGSAGEMCVALFKRLVLDFAIEWSRVETKVRNTKKELLVFKDFVRDDEGVVALMRLRRKYPFIKNILRLKKCIHLLGQVFELLFIQYKNEIETKRDKLYSLLSVHTTLDIFNNLPQYPIKFKTGMKILICDLRRDGPSASGPEDHSQKIHYCQVVLDENAIKELETNTFISPDNCCKCVNGAPL